MAGLPVLSDVVLSGGRIALIGDGGATAEEEEEFDAAGRVLIPGLVDAHVHIDKAYQLDAVSSLVALDEASGLAEAMRVSREWRHREGLEALRPGMERAVAAMVRQGTVAARVQVEVEVGADPGAVGLHQEVLATVPELDARLVAFPQYGGSESPDFRLLLEDALDRGCSVVGGCPYADSSPADHLAVVFDIAVERDLPVDLHVDLTDDPAASHFDLLLREVERTGWHGRVTLGHMTVLASLDPDLLLTRIGQLRDHGIGIVAIPTTDLWLSGRTAWPVRRGVAPIRQLIQAGVRVALASNNHQNAFTPVGGGGLLREAWLAGLVAHMGESESQASLLDAVTVTPGELMGLGPTAIEVGSTFPLLLLDCEDPRDAVREAPAVLRRFDPATMEVP